MGHNEASRPAIRELYREVMLDLLPKRYPSIFRIVGDKFFNLATSSSHRISSALKDPTLMLRHLGENVEEDFYFMVPGSPEFVLEGFVSCFPQGLLPPAKVGMSVSEIHQPVPSYEGRLKKGVNRCFERMERGQTIGRPNVCAVLVEPESLEGSLINGSGLYNATMMSFTFLLMGLIQSKPMTVLPRS